MKKRLCSLLLVLTMLSTLLVAPASALEADGSTSAGNETYVYLGIKDYGTVEADSKPDFVHRFYTNGKEVEYTVASDDKYAVQTKLQEGYVYELTIEDGVVTDAEPAAVTAEGEITAVSTSAVTIGGKEYPYTAMYQIDNTAAGATAVTVASYPVGETAKVYGDTVYLTFIAEPYTAPVHGTPGVRTLKNYLQTAMNPVGTALYVYGGSWDWQDVNSSNQALTIGLPQSWIDFFQQQDANYTYMNDDDPAHSYFPHNSWNQYYYAGVDCSAYIGWTIYNVMHTESTTNDKSDGYVMSAVKMAKTFAEKGWGEFTRDIKSFKPGDIFSMSGHVWTVLGVCGDVLLLPALALAAGLSARSLVKADVQLANNAVLAMYQDEDANMWIGTYDGLHLYNGKNTFVFRMELDNEFSLCSNIVLEIAPAEKGYLWVATSLGINKFSLRERRVVESYMQYVDVENIASDSEGNTVLFSGEDFITCYRPGRAFFEDVYIPGVRAAEIVAVWSEAPRVFCTLGRDGELVRYRLNDGEGKSLVRVSGRQLSARPVRKAFFNGGRLHFVDTSGGLWRYTYKDESLVLLSDLSQLGETGFTVSTVCSFEDEVYVGFLAGALGRVPEKGGRCELIASDYRVFCLWADCNQDILWVGTDGYGVHMYCDKEELFTTLLMEDMPQKVLKPVRAIHTDDRGNLWIGTKGDGVIRIRDYESYAGGNIPVDHLTRFDRGKGLTSNEVFSFCSSPARNVIWLGTSGPGLTYYSYGDDRMRTLPLQPGMPEIRGVHQMCEVNDSTLYLACDTDALVELTIGKGDRPVVTAMRRYRFRLERRDCNEFYALIRESDSTLLLGMRGGYGLIRFDMRTKKYVFVDMHRLQSRALGDLLCLCKSRESGLYCGASSGLILLTPEGDIRQFNRRNGIVNDMIHGVLEDAHGCIWLSTNKGLAQYSPGHDFFHNYSSSDLRVIEFCDDAYWKCPYTDRLFFGGVNGVVWIDPAAEPPSNYKPRLRFMDLELPDGTLVPLSDYTGDGHDPLPVRIAPRTTGFAVSFVAVDYLNGDNYEYSYMLEGYSDEWVELQKNNRVAFMNIPAGSYLLHVRSRATSWIVPRRSTRCP